MFNLYRLTKNGGEVAQWFDAVDTTAGANVVEQVYPGYPGLVVVDGGIRSMVWGFPLAQTSRKTGRPLKPKPVNNTRADKLDTFFWRDSFEERRCLIPLEAFAEAEGERGKMTRTWITLPDRELFAVAGIWRESEEWGRSYSMIMTDANQQMSSVHDRMPVVLRGPEQWRRWQSGSTEEARSICIPYDGELCIDRTPERWAG